MKTLLFAAVSGAALFLAGCNSASGPADEAGTPAATPTEESAAPKAADTAANEGPRVGSLAWAVRGEWRNPQNKARNRFRRPGPTLNFFGIKPSQTVVEITPGGGWYTEIIAPFLAKGGGTYYAANFPTNGNERREAGLQRFKDRFADTSIFGEIQHSTVGPADWVEMAPAGTADLVLSFRNVHNWMGGGFEAKMAQDAYEALKPGGIFGVVEHRLPSSAEQDPQAGSGYVHEDYMIQVAQAAGFEFVGGSDVNNNPKDTADHPFGVWTLPPTSFTGNEDRPAPADFDPEKYKAIGESDRFTLKFRKPAE